MILAGLNQRPVPIASLNQRPVLIAQCSVKETPYASVVMIYENLLNTFYDDNGDIVIIDDAYSLRARLIVPVTGSTTDVTPSSANNIADVLFVEDANNDVQPRPR